MNIYAMDMRQFDPAIARWVVQDPVIHHNQSQYNGFYGNPVFWADPSGADANTSLGSDLNGNRRYNSYGLFMPMTERGVSNDMAAAARANGGKVISSDSMGTWVRYYLGNENIDYSSLSLEAAIIQPIYAYEFILNYVEDSGIFVFEWSIMSGGVTIAPLGIFVQKGEGRDLTQHEYGHYLQYKKMGALDYYINIGLPSLYNAMENSFETALFGGTVFSVPHNNYYTETDANIEALNFYKSSIDKQFKTRNPTTTLQPPLNWHQRLQVYATVILN